VGLDLERERQLAAEAAAALVEDGMAVGLGTGSTASSFVRALAARELEIRCVATSPATEELARALGLRLEPFAGPDGLTRLDLAVDGADQIAPDGWVVKGNGGAHTREKIVARAADRFVVVASSDKLVERVVPPVPLELLPFGLASTLAALGDARLRDAAPTPDGGVLADWYGPLEHLKETACFLASVPGVVDHGLFPPELIAEAIVGRGDGVERVRYGA
jgi:ribose 5-phosphate isomerase A